MTFRKFGLQLLPFIVALFVGAVFLIGAYFMSESTIKNLFINLSATLVGITLSYISYQLIKKWSDTKLQETLFDYSKVQIDYEIMSIVSQIQKMLQPLGKVNKSFDGIREFLSLSEKELIEKVADVELLGYQIFKNWHFSINNIQKFIENGFTLKYMSNEQIICLVELFKSIKALDKPYNYIDSFFEATGKTSTEFSIIPPSSKQELPFRSILLKKIPGKSDQGVVVDFGDITLDKLKLSLNLYKLKSPETYIPPLHRVLKNIDQWIKLSGNTILIDTSKMRIWDNVEKRYL